MTETEKKFNDLNQFQETVKAKLKEFGLTTYEEVQQEMNRLQGDFRTLDTIRTQAPKLKSDAKTIVAKPKAKSGQS